MEYEIENDPKQDMEIIRNVKNFIKKKINNHKNDFFDVDYHAEKCELYSIIRNSVEMHERDSVIIYGRSGCGKTAMVKNVLRQLTDEKVINDRSATIIHLHGLLHTSESLALKDIARQLPIKENIDCETSSTFKESLCYLLKKLRDQKDEFASVIFVLDHFDLFLDHKDQILLYDLFDITKVGEDPICVVGLMENKDDLEFMEHKVSSRFVPKMIKMSKNFTAEIGLMLFKEIFTLRSEDLKDVDEMYKTAWNSRIEELVINQEVKEALKGKIEEKNLSQREFRSLLFKLSNTVSYEKPLLTEENIKNVFAVIDQHVLMLSGLCPLELALVVAVKHQSVNYEGEPFNFEMIYNQFLKFSKNSRNATNMTTERSVVFKAFQRLQELEIIEPLKKKIGNSMGKELTHYQLYNFTLNEHQVNEGVKLSKNVSTDFRQWATSSI